MRRGIRGQINRSRRMGVEVRATSGTEDLLIFARLYEQTGQRLLATKGVAPNAARPEARAEMLDILARRGAAEGVDALIALDARRRELLPEIENAQAERKTLSRQVGEAKQRGEEAEDLVARVQGLKETIESGKEELEKWLARFPGAVLVVPHDRRFLDRTVDISVSEEHHGPADDRRYEYLPTFFLRGLQNLNLEFTPAR